MVEVALIDGPLNGPDTPAKRHASAMRQAILRLCPTAKITSFPVFETTLTCSVADICAEMKQAIATAPELVLCSFGLPRDPPSLFDQIENLHRTGAVIVASRPARSATPVWPAAYPGVFAVQGDARCQVEDWSFLGDQRWFGACPILDQAQGLVGASIAAAHFAGHVAATLRDMTAETKPQLGKVLQAKAAWVGPESRRA